MNTVKPIEPVDTRIHLQEWPSDSGTEIDCNTAVLIILKAIEYCEDNSKPKVIGIGGQTATGKSILAHALFDALDGDSQLIDMSALASAKSTLGSVRLPEIMSEKTSHIVDEAEYCDQEQLASLVNSAVAKESAVIFMFQSGDDLLQEIRDQMQYFTLTVRDGLRVLNAH